MPKPKPIRLTTGEIVDQLILARLALREGEGASREASERAHALAIDALNTAVPGIVDVGFDCDGDGAPDVKTLRDVVAAVGGAACDCRWAPPPAPTTATRTTSARTSRRRKGGS